MSFPDEETLIWAKKKYGCSGSGGGNFKAAMYAHGQTYEAFGDIFYKISDEAPTKEQLMGGAVGLSHEYPDESLAGGGTKTEHYYLPIISESISFLVREEEGYIAIFGRFLSVPEESAATVGFPSGGIWVQDETDYPMHMGLFWPA